MALRFFYIQVALERSLVSQSLGQPIVDQFIVKLELEVYFGFKQGKKFHY